LFLACRRAGAVQAWRPALAAEPAQAQVAARFGCRSRGFGGFRIFDRHDSASSFGTLVVSLSAGRLPSR
jgi:hypothetical protein